MQYHIIQDLHNNYILVRMPDYRSSDWYKSINEEMFTHDFDNLDHNFGAIDSFGKQFKKLL